MNKPESLFKALLLKEYEDRLNSFLTLNETRVTDDEGKVILDPDLNLALITCY